MRAQVQPAVSNITPVYEGWLPNPDGSFELLFGYMNREWSGETHIPIGPSNTHGAGRPGSGPADELFPAPEPVRVSGPRAEGFRHEGNRLDADEQGEDRKGVRHAASRDYVLDDTVDHVEHRHRRRAEHDAGHGRQQGAGADGRRPEEPHGQGRRAGGARGRGDRRWEAEPEEHAGDGSAATTSLPATANGLRLSFFVYRGPGDGGEIRSAADRDVGEHARRRQLAVVGGWIAPPVPEGNTWQARATFAEPGTYVIRALAHDGGLWASQDVTVVVSK